MFLEVLVLTIFYLTGAAVLSVAGLRGWAVLSLGYLAGLLVWVLFGTFFAVIGVPTDPLFLLSALVSFALFLSYACSLHRVLSKKDYMIVITGAFLIALFVWSFSALGNSKYHIDSFRYLLVTGLLAENQFELLNNNLLTKRMLGAPLLHLPAALYDASHVISITPIMGASLLGALGYFLIRVQPRQFGFPFSIVAVLLPVLLLASNNRFIWNSFYVNGHLFAGAAMLSIVASLWLFSREEDKTGQGWLLVLACLAIPSLVVTRPEGFILAGFAIAPFLLSPQLSFPAKASVLAVFSVSTSGYYGYVALAVAPSIWSASVSISGPFFLGVLGIVSTPLLMWRHVLEWRIAIMRVAEGLLWVSLIIYSIRDWSIMSTSLVASWHNFVLGSGSWGASVVFLVVLVIGTLFLYRRELPIEVRFPLTASIPMFYLLAYLRGSGYRIGNGDSLNRMLIEIVPLAVFFIGLGLVFALLAWQKSRSSLKEASDQA